jgi:hypothetical protein
LSRQGKSSVLPTDVKEKLQKSRKKFSAGMESLDFSAFATCHERQLSGILRP